MDINDFIDNIPLKRKASVSLAIFLIYKKISRRDAYYPTEKKKDLLQQGDKFLIYFYKIIG